MKRKIFGALALAGVAALGLVGCKDDTPAEFNPQKIFRQTVTPYRIFLYICRYLTELLNIIVYHNG